MENNKLKKVSKNCLDDMLAHEGLAIMVLDFLCFKDLYVFINRISKSIQRSITDGIVGGKVNNLLNKCLMRQLKLHISEYKLPF